MTGSRNIDDSTFAMLADSDAGGSIQSLANMFCDSLKSVSNDLEPLEATSKIKIDEFPDEYVIYPEEVFGKLNDIQIHKSPGPDNLPNWFLRDFAVYLAEPLCCIFNSSLRQCAFPSMWKRANIVPIPKITAPKSIASDFRPISLTPTISKIFESLVGQRMLDSVADKIDDKQYGARKGRSTVHALVDMLHSWHSALDRGDAVRTVSSTTQKLSTTSVTRWYLTKW
jgi:hypothetical protein